MPCLFFNNTNQLNNLDLSNPFNMAATLSPTSSAWSLNHFNSDEYHLEQRKYDENYFEPLPFLETNSQTKSMNYPQLSQKHTIIKQSKHDSIENE